MKDRYAAYCSPLSISAIILGLLITAAAVYIAIERVTHHEAALLDTETRLIHDAVLRRLNAAEEAVHGLDIALTTVPRIDAARFHLLTEQLLKRHDFLGAAYYLARVDAGDRVAVEARLQGEGFAIREHGANGLQTAPARERYFPVLYQEPPEPATAHWLGFDLLSDPAAAPVIAHAIDHAEALIASPSPLSLAPQRHLLIAPTFAGLTPPETEAERRAAVNGLLALEIDAARLLEDLVLDRHIEVELQISSHAEPGQTREFARAGGELFGEAEENIIDWQTTQREIEVAAHRIDLHLSKELHWEDTESWPVALAAGIGLTLTALLLLLAHAYTIRQRDLQRRNVEIQDKVEERTCELRTANKQLYEITVALEKEKKEQRALYLQLKEAHSQLLQSEKMASVGVLAAGVAHEINNPVAFVQSNLGSLHGYCADLLHLIDACEQTPAGTAGDAAARIAREIDLPYLKDDLLALIEESKDGLQRVREIVANLKDFSRTGETNWQLADLHTGLDSTLTIVHNELKYKAEVIKEYAELPQIECIPSQLNQVFMNLLVNAAHAIETRGTVTVRTGSGDGRVWVEVADTGKGIDPAHLQRIFDPFFTTKPVGSGTGLGLSVSYGIVEKHRGRIEVHSELGKGTTFRVWLPLQQPEQDSEPEAESNDDPVGTEGKKD